MLAGRPAFGGRNVVEILHATLYEQPPALTGSPAVAAADRVIRRALAKRPAERPASADAMAEELRAVRGTAGDDTPALARALTRLVVLPFRVLRPDPETDFLAFSLPDAIATSLSGIGSLVVRSSATAARFAGEAPDLKALAAEADVDRVVMGTLLRAGDQLRAAAQLVEAPGGTLLTSHTVQSSLGDLFRLQDDIARRVVEALSLPLGGADATPTPPAPHDARAYELYLRANELARTYDGLPAGARPVPALPGAGSELRSRLGPARPLPPGDRQVHRRFGGQRRRAPRRPSAAPSSSTRGSRWRTSSTPTSRRTWARPSAALVRLLGEAGRHGNDPELFAGLVHACRYCGLYEQSIAAHDEARRLDPNVPTSLEQTILMTGDIERLLAVERPSVAGSGDDGIRVIGLGLAGRRDEARRALLGDARGAQHPAFRCLDRLPDGVARPAPRGHARRACPALGDLKIMDDPEAIFQEGWLLCDVGEHERGLGHLRRAVAKGYFVAPTLAGQPALRRAAQRSRASRSSWRRRKRAASRRWPRSARPAESGFSATAYWEGSFRRLDALLDEMKTDEA